MTTHRQRAIQPERIVLWPRDELEPRLDLSPSVISFQCQKALDKPTGSFSVNLLPRPITEQGPARLTSIAKLYKSIQPGDMISIGYDEPGGIMLGIVTRVSRRMVMSDQAQMAISITGEDFGKILTQDNIIHASLTVDDESTFARLLEEIVGPDHSLTQILRGVWGPEAPGSHDDTPGVFIGNNVADVVDFVLKTSVTMTIPHVMFAATSGGNEKPGDFITADASITTWNDGRVWSEGLNNYHGNLWGFLKGVVDPDFYEVVLQTVPNGTDLPRVSLIIRPKPFDEESMEFETVTEQTGSTWEGLTTLLDGDEYHIVDADMVLSLDLGRSEADVFSYYEVTARHDLIGNGQSQAMGLYYPAIDTWQLRKFGLRAYRSEVALVGNNVIAVAPEGEEADQEELSSEAREFRNRLLNWHRLSDYFEAGSCSVVGKDRYRPGDKVFLPWLEPAHGDEIGLQFYCPVVTWSWSFGQPYLCKLDLIRGHNNGVIDKAKADIGADAPSSNPSHIVSA